MRFECRPRGRHSASGCRATPGPMGHGLTESAIEAIHQWQFAPPMVDGVPVAVVHEIVLAFHP